MRYVEQVKGTPAVTDVGSMSIAGYTLPRNEQPRTAHKMQRWMDGLMDGWTASLQTATSKCMDAFH